MLAIAGLAAVEPASGAMRAPLWRGVKEVTLRCDAEAPGFSPTFCAAALAEARRGAPYPVRAADGSGGVATLALRLTAAMRDGAPVLTVDGERAVSIDDAQGAMRPRSTRAAPGEAIGDTLTRALDAALPWRRTRSAPPFRQH